MKTQISISDKQYSFGAIMSIANKLDTLLEREMKEFDITSKQWMLLAIIENMKFNNPTIKEVAAEMGTSHQNVKQLALKLEKKGHIYIKKDEKDGRVNRLFMTHKSRMFWDKLSPTGSKFVDEVFKDLDSDEIKITKEVLEKILSNLSTM